MASRLQDVLLRGVAASRPAATAVATGTVYFATDTFVHTQSDGTDWQTWSATSVGGDVTGPATTVEKEIALWDGTSGTLLESATGTGFVKVISGVYQVPVATVSLTTEVSGDLPYANLAQGSALSVLGVTGNATADNASIAAGSDHQVLRRSGTSVAFGAVNLAESAAVTGVLPVANISTTVRTKTITVVFDGGGAEISVGAQAWVRSPTAGTITAWTLTADITGAIAIDVWVDDFAAYPPTDADSITDGNEPEIPASGVSAEDTDLGNWLSTAIVAGDVIKFNVDSVTDITYAVLQLTMTVS